jgi:putative ABC transport system permease protein
MKPRWKKMLTDVWGHKIRSTLVIASIAVGLFAIGALLGIRVNLQKDMQEGYVSIHPANIQLSVSDFDDQLVESIKKIKGVEDVAGVRVFTLRVLNKDGDWVSLHIRAIHDFSEMKIDQSQWRGGKWPPDDREIIVDQYRYNQLGKEIGEYIQIQMPNGKKRELPMVGLVKDQTIGSSGAGGGFFLAPLQGYITEDTLEWLGQPDAYNFLLVRVTADQDSLPAIRKLSDSIRKKVEKNQATVYYSSYRQSDDHPNSTYVDAIHNVLYVLTFLIVFLSGFLITNTLQALLNQQVQQIGIMKIFGARSSQISGIYIMLILVYGFIALFLAFPAAVFFVNHQVRFLSDAINFQVQDERIAWSAVIIQAFVALVVPQLAGFVPILRGVNITIQEATSGIRNNPSAGQQKPALIHKSIPRPLLISLRNSFRNKGRVILTVTTLALGGAIFIGTFNVRVSIMNHIARVGKYFLADVNLTLDRPYRVNRIKSVLEEIPDVAMVEAWTGTRAEIILQDGTVADSVNLVAPPSDSPLVQPILIDGRWIIPGDKNAIALSERFQALIPDLKLNDMITLRIKGEDKRFVVVGFFQLVGKSAGYLAYTDYEFLSKELGIPNQSSSYRIVSRIHNLDINGQIAFAKQIEDHMIAQGIAVSETTAGASLVENTTDGLNVLTTFLMVLAGLTASVGVIGLMGTMSLNVMERTAEIGIMRAIGATDAVVMQLVIVEGLIIGLVSWIVGCVLAFPISNMMSSAINKAIFGGSSSVQYTWTGFLIWLGAVIVLSIVASILPARNAARLTIREVLAYE